MKRRLFTLLIFTGLLLAVLTWPTHKSASRLVANGGYQTTDAGFDSDLLDQIVPAAQCAGLCDIFRRNCNDVAAQLFGNCRKSGGSINQCLSEYDGNYATCLSGTGCALYFDD